MSEGGPLGYLVINVLEAAGHDSEDAVVWDPDLKQGYARVEIRGGPKTIKKFTSTKAVDDNGITWVEQLSLEVLEGANELRIMLCRPKEASGERSSTSIVAACGIYMKDILEAAPVDKYFELYKPGGGAAGGFIRVAISFLEPDQVRNGDLDTGAGGVRQQKQGLLGTALRVGGAVAVAALAYGALSKAGVIGKKKEEEAAPAGRNGKAVAGKKK
ncbi:hypothetical protein COHA_000826 [Chlorella ohadii]|uniref:C2 domain-containing protein n=1 Tax=Chlorella ohadii TaxID=2649997 RepID=A0AAD5DY26_9CHLO|nr:hypothetical protein COHA_000826 [Chlorella ohadii]